MTRTTIRSEDISENAVDTTGIQTDIALLGFKVAANGSLAAYGLSKQTIDAFEDTTGIDTGASTNELHSGGYFSGGLGNYYGDNSDGSLSTGGNVSLVVPNKNGSYDGDMVVAQYSSLTINTGHTFTTDQPCRGLFVYVSGDCTINGNLSMSARGGLSDPTVSGGSDSSAVATNGLQLGLITSGGIDTFTNDGTAFAGAGTSVKTAIANQTNISSNGTIFTISKLGGAGGVAVDSAFSPTAISNGTAGTSGSTGSATISTGGGGSGAGYAYIAKGGDGGDGGAFSGGAGGGGHTDGTSGSSNIAAMDGGDYGGAGGQPRNWSGAAGYASEGAGAGNPKGTLMSRDYGNPGIAPTEAQDGVGGIIWLVVGGSLTIGSTGSITANGSSGGTGGGASGGGSGGGAVMVLYKGTFTNNGSIAASAGAGGDGANADGGNGGAGGTHTAQLGIVNQNLTLVSNASTADVVPDKADIVMTYTNGAGTATINTDLKAYVSRDGGTTWTQATLVADGTSGGHSILVAHNIDISSQPSGTSMKYKIETLNQSASKETRIQAVSLGWK